MSKKPNDKQPLTMHDKIGKALELYLDDCLDPASDTKPSAALLKAAMEWSKTTNGTPRDGAGHRDKLARMAAEAREREAKG